MSLLTQSQINEIKRSIGDLFRKLLQEAEVKLILIKSAGDRKEKEIDILVDFLKKTKFLSQEKKL